MTKVVLRISELIMLTVVTSNNMKIIVAENLRGFFSKDHPLKVMRSLRYFILTKMTILADG